MLTKLRPLYIALFALAGACIGLIYDGPSTAFIGAGLGCIIGTFFRAKRHREKE